MLDSDSNSRIIVPRPNKDIEIAAACVSSVHAELQRYGYVTKMIATLTESKPSSQYEHNSSQSQPASTICHDQGYPEHAIQANCRIYH